MKLVLLLLFCYITYITSKTTFLVKLDGIPQVTIEANDGQPLKITSTEKGDIQYVVADKYKNQDGDMRYCLDFFAFAYCNPDNDDYSVDFGTFFGKTLQYTFVDDLGYFIVWDPVDHETHPSEKEMVANIQKMKNQYVTVSAADGLAFLE
jgi:hypothetical protein